MTSSTRQQTAAAANAYTLIRAVCLDVQTRGIDAWGELSTFTPIRKRLVDAESYASETSDPELRAKTARLVDLAIRHAWALPAQTEARRVQRAAYWAARAEGPADPKGTAAELLDALERAASGPNTHGLRPSAATGGVR